MDLKLKRMPVVMLLFGAKDIEYNNAVVLADAVREAIDR